MKRLLLIAARTVSVLLLTFSIPATAPAQNGVPRPDHVVIAIEENKSFGKIISSASAPYINSLAEHGALFVSSFAVTHPSQPNYLALFSGSTHGIGDDSLHVRIVINRKRLVSRAEIDNFPLAPPPGAAAAKHLASFEPADRE